MDWMPVSVSVLPGAIIVVEREAEPYDERKVMENKIKRYNNNNWWGNQRVIRDKVLP